jgi:hypothetical protein
MRMHEVGTSSPYQLSFAAKAKSGASFGFMQGDLAASQPVVQRTFHAVLAADQIPENTINDFAQRLSIHLIANPLSASETATVNNALNAHRDLVDAMDDAILSGVFGGLDKCLQQATAHGRSIQPIAQLYMAMWINMSGPPTTLLRWLGGEIPALRLPVDRAPQVIDKAAIESYLQATDYFVENPRNFAHMQQSAAAGAALLPAA